MFATRLARPSTAALLANSSKSTIFTSRHLSISRPCRQFDPTEQTTRQRLVSLFKITKFNPSVKPVIGPDGETDASRNGLRTLFYGCVALAFVTYGVFKPAHSPLLDQDKYKAFPVEWVEVLDRDETGSTGLKDGTYKVLTMRLPDNHPKVLGNLETNEEGIYHIMIKDSSLQIERPYTIFSPPEHVDGLPTQLSILVKREPQGEVSRFIHSLKRFSWIEARGPFPTQVEVVRPSVIEQDPNIDQLKGWSLQGWDRVLMISGGTGITPFTQLLHTLSPPRLPYNPLKPQPPPPDLPTITLVHTSNALTLSLLEDYLPEPSLLPARLELADLSPSRFGEKDLGQILIPGHASIQSTVTAAKEEGESFWASLFGKPSTVSTPDTQSLDTASSSGRPTALEKGKKTLILVSGPDGMIESVSGRRGAALGGVLGQLGLTGEDGFEIRRFWNSQLPVAVQANVVPRGSVQNVQVLPAFGRS
ncbi:NADH-cytochrome b-5 reductase [Phaffia rhodozyma]|uniref:NADH-cytochrome b-5 reductase n=1 Tax=Phaffia rhodozyma TaxID=264483 RepID=A0A0F7SWF9_PHARH|nr:NADH-cytochrome b-5 reductase [Phaffia rhodozyma]